MANLTVGSRGPEVVTLQQELNRQLFPNPHLTADGIFGSLTRNAVTAFQRQAGILVDGIVGPQTRAALGMPNPGGQFTHRIRLHFRSISLTDVPFNSILSHTQLVYAQYGIRVDFGSGMSLALSPDEARRLEQVDGQCRWQITGGEYAELQQMGGAVPSNEIAVYFINRFSQSLNGCGGHMANRPACLVAKAGTKWCTAHEVCHVLLTSSFAPVHINQVSNLMHPVDLARSNTPGLTPAQVTQIKASPLCRPI
jgi:hypothetical protein